MGRGGGHAPKDALPGQAIATGNRAPVAGTVPRRPLARRCRPGTGRSVMSGPCTSSAPSPSPRPSRPSSTTWRLHEHQRVGPRHRRDPRTSGDGGVGTTYANTSEFMGREVELAYETLDHDRPRRLRFRGKQRHGDDRDTLTLAATAPPPRSTTARTSTSAVSSTWWPRCCSPQARQARRRDGRAAPRDAGSARRRRWTWSSAPDVTHRRPIPSSRHEPARDQPPRRGGSRGVRGAATAPHRRRLRAARHPRRGRGRRPGGLDQAPGQRPRGDPRPDRLAGHHDLADRAGHAPLRPDPAREVRRAVAAGAGRDRAGPRGLGQPRRHGVVGDAGGPGDAEPRRSGLRSCCTTCSG